MEEKAKKMETVGEWGGQVDVQVLSILLDRRIWVHRAGQDTLPHGDESENARRTDCLQLSYHRQQYHLGAHYNSVVPGEWGGSPREGCDNHIAPLETVEEMDLRGDDFNFYGYSEAGTRLVAQAPAEEWSTVTKGKKGASQTKWQRAQQRQQQAAEEFTLVGGKKKGKKRGKRR
eukprot:COSAG04_NODE_2208_length_4527_cov_1.984643_2_plen_174_part_00